MPMPTDEQWGAFADALDAYDDATREFATLLNVGGDMPACIGRLAVRTNVAIEAARVLLEAHDGYVPATPRTDGLLPAARRSPPDDESLIAGGRAVTCPACCPLRHIHADKNPPHHVDCPLYVDPSERDRGPVK